MDTPIVREFPDKGAPNLRAERALELYRHHGRETTRVALSVYRVPSQDGTRSYDVVYGEREECHCPDHHYRGVACVHLLAVGIHCAKSRGATVRALAALEETYRHELMDEDERMILRDKVLRLRRRFSR